MRLSGIVPFPLRPEQLFESAPCGLIVTDAGGRILQVNAAVERLLGFSRSELIEKRAFTGLLAKGSQLYFETYCLQLLFMQEEVQSLALKLVGAGGQALPVLVNARLGQDEDADEHSIHFAIFDASGRQAFERELIAAKQRAEVSEERATTLARTLQTVLIPPLPPVIPGLDLAAAYRPAGSGDEVGGDFYDIFEVDADDWVVVIGDVSGKGAAAAVVTAMARDTVRAAAVRESSPAHALRTLHERLLAAEVDRFCTAVVLRLRRRGRDWECTFAVGGHSLPLLAGAGARSRPVGEIGSLVGTLPDPHFQDSQVLLRAGDALLLYTDGVSEGRHHGEFFGDERIADIVSGGLPDASATVGALLASVLDFQEGDPRDDIAIVALRVP